MTCSRNTGSWDMGNSYVGISEQLFDVDAWLDGFVYGGTARYFHNRELEKRIQGWIEAASLTKVHAWEDFCRHRCQGETRAVGLLAVGRRIAATEPQRAVDILVDAWKGFAEFFHMHGPLASEICSAVMRLDRERGYELLFESFQQQYQRYPESIIYELDWLLDFSGDLPAFDAARLYVIWSAHNRRLVAGLSAKPVDMSWLADDGGGEFRDHCLRYLLDLLDYSVVDVRRLALEQLFCLTQERHDLAKSILDWWPELSSGQKEHVASWLFSLGIANPASIAFLALGRSHGSTGHCRTKNSSDMQTSIASRNARQCATSAGLVYTSTPNSG